MGGLIHQKRELQPIFTELRTIKDFAPALRGSRQPSEYLSKSINMNTNTETAMLSISDPPSPHFTLCLALMEFRVPALVTQKVHFSECHYYGVVIAAIVLVAVQEMP